MAPSRQTSSVAIEHVAAKLGRAAAGALVFALPMLMTMEMWWLGFYLERPRILLLVVLTIPLLVGLSYHSGFEDTFRWNEDLRDALIALGIGALASALALWLFGIISAHSTPNEIVGKIALQMVPASIGALLARSQLGGTKGDRDGKKSPPSYAGELFLMAVGALFLALNVAPTEEMILIAYKMSATQEVGLAIVSLLVMHAFVYSVNFHGGSHPPPASSFASPSPVMPSSCW